jgi:hypothetical protein
MSTNQDLERDQRQDQQQREVRVARIRQRVIHTLGPMIGLQMVQVLPLWDDRYRVNVLVGADRASARVARSYFVEADTTGNIIDSIPTIAGPSSATIKGPASSVD